MNRVHVEMVRVQRGGNLGHTQWYALVSLAQSLPREPRVVQALARMKVEQMAKEADRDRLTPEQGWKWLPGLMGMPVDQGAGAPGFEVVVSASNQTTGAVTTVLADRVDPGTPNNNLWRATFPVLADAEYFIEAWVRVDQPLGRLAFTLLEPRSDDGFANWALLDEQIEAGTYPVLRGR